jgi:hypothetical protein
MRLGISRIRPPSLRPRVGSLASVAVATDPAVRVAPNPAHTLII